MKTVIVIAIMSTLLASAAYAAGGSGFGNVDIVGSDLNNIKIFSDDANLGDTEVVGSSIKNVEILPAPEKEKKPECKKDRHDDVKCYWDSACMDYSHDKPHVSCSKPHLGVDAWYGKYWFNDQIYTPKWPQNYQ